MNKFIVVQKPPKIVSTKEALLVSFRSDGTMNFKGFSVSYMAVEPSIENVEEDSMVTPFPGYMKSIYSAGENDYEEEDTYDKWQ